MYEQQTNAVSGQDATHLLRAAPLGSVGGECHMPTCVALYGHTGGALLYPEPPLGEAAYQRLQATGEAQTQTYY
eukprot:COSAG05_NODE_29_length_29038_cov_1237.466985_28_plen_74_part_00